MTWQLRFRPVPFATREGGGEGAKGPSPLSTRKYIILILGCFRIRILPKNHRFLGLLSFRRLLPTLGGSSIRFLRFLAQALRRVAWCCLRVWSSEELRPVNLAVEGGSIEGLSVPVRLFFGSNPLRSSERLHHAATRINQIPQVCLLPIPKESRTACHQKADMRCILGKIDRSGLWSLLGPVSGSASPLRSSENEFGWTLPL